MAKCGQTAAQFITEAFRPRIAVMASPEVEAICMKNDLTLTELLQPFSKLSQDVQYRDPLNTLITVHSLHLALDDWNLSAPPPAHLARKQLADCVAQSLPPATEAGDGAVRPDTPWFETWRQRLLQVEPPGEHEFVRRYVACLLAVSSSAAAPLQQLQQLAQHQHQLQHGQPAGGARWFSNNVLIYHLLVTDSGVTQDDSAEAVFEQVKSSYGAHCCHHLRLNSRKPEHREPHNPDPWASFVLRRPTNPDGTPAPLSGTETPVEVAELTSLPSMVVEGELSHRPPPVTDHPLSPGSPLPVRAVASSPALLSTVTGGVTAGVIGGVNEGPPPGEVMVPVEGDGVRKEGVAANPEVLVNRVSYPSSQSGVQGHGMCLSASDLDRVTIFISDMCVRGLMPHVERQMRALSDVVNNRKGVSRSLISATKRWFGGNKPGAAAANSVIYSHEAPEIQVRRLGDLAFMFGHYDLAYQAYHTAKRDFNADSAWLHFSGAVEMAALSVFLHGGQGKPFPQHYLDQAVSTYLETCRMPNYALRATLFSTECLKDRTQFAEAALQFIRLTAEDADLRSALLLEQAAHCFLNSQPTALRKYAFHMILSGHRFSKAGQRRHALRAYKQAAQVYEGHGWRLADDHIAFTLGRQSEALQDHEAARVALGSLLSGAAATETRQSPAQQAAFVREYLHVIRQCGDASSDPPPQLPVPHLLSQQTRVLISPVQQPPAEGWSPASGASFSDDEEDNAKWFRLEELCLDRLGQNNTPFKPTIQCMTGKTNNRTQPRVGASEPVHVQLVLRNPLRVCLELTDLRLRYTFSGRDQGTEQEAVTAHTLSRCTLDESATQEVTLTITAHMPGELTILGYEFSLALPAVSADGDPPAAVQSQSKEPLPSVRGSQPITVRGRRLNGTKEERSGVFYAEDKRLQLRVDEESSQLQLSFRGLPSSLLCGQIHPVLLRVTNSGRRPLQRLLLATPDPHLMALELQSPPDDDRWQQVRGGPNDIPLASTAATGRSWAEASRLGRVTEIPLPSNGLSPGESILRRLWLRAPHADGTRSLEILLCGVDEPNRTRLLRHSGKILVTPSAAISVLPSRSAGPRHKLHLDVQVSGVQAVDSPIVLERVAVAAEEWKLDRTVKVEGAEVGRGETAYLGVVVERVEEDEGRDSVEEKEKMLNIDAMSLTSGSSPQEQKQQLSQHHQEHQESHHDQEHHQKNSATLADWPCVQFLLRHRLQLPALVAPPPTGPPGADPEGPSAESRALAAAVRVGATVVLQWRTQGVDAAGRETTVYGQHHVTAELLGDSSATYPAAGEPEPLPPATIIPSRPATPPPPHWPGEGVMDRLVTVVPLHRPAVNHNFDRKRLCVIPVTMLVQNHCRCDLVVHLSTVPAGGSASRPVLPYSSHVSADLIWVGRTHPHVTVPAGGSTRLPLAAAVTRPGLYDLGSVGVACRRAGADSAELTEQSARAESAVIVRGLVGSGKTARDGK